MGKTDKSDGCVPINLINQLNEYTAGGFILFYFNSENGAPEQVMTFDSPAHFLAFRKHIEDWTNALQDLSIEGEKANIVSNYTENSDSEDDVL